MTTTTTATAALAASQAKYDARQAYNTARGNLGTQPTEDTVATLSRATAALDAAERAFDIAVTAWAALPADVRDAHLAEWDAAGTHPRVLRSLRTQ